MGFSVQVVRGSRESGQPLLPLRRDVERVAPGGDDRETRGAFLGIHPNGCSLRFGCSPKFKTADHERSEIPSRVHRAFVGLCVL